MSTNYRSHVTLSGERVTVGQLEEKSTKTPELNEGFIDALSVCNCSHAPKSSSTTSNLSLEYQAKQNLSGNLPDASLYTNQVGKSSAKVAMELKQLQKTEPEMTRLFQPKAESLVYKREIERKYVIEDILSLGTVAEQLAAFYPQAEHISGRSNDMFWKAPNTDFIRLRENTRELTVKITDGPSIENRLEENLVISNYVDAIRWTSAVFGPAVGNFDKLYSIFYTPNAVVSVYMILGRTELFLEVEADSIEQVKWVSQQLQGVYKLRQEMRSLFQIVFEGDK